MHFLPIRIRHRSPKKKSWILIAYWLFLLLPLINMHFVKKMLKCYLFLGMVMQYHDHSPTTEPCWKFLVRETFSHVLKTLVNMTTKMFGIATNSVSFISWHRLGLQKHSCPARIKTGQESPIFLAPMQPGRQIFQCYWEVEISKMFQAQTCKNESKFHDFFK